ncbi:hypothetical protein [Eilatimonas milleporae]|uniref:Uncharacterized protein n=1 Tax=Eilatimonas milleporae TaxID=911205 RepID=A0A3M0CE40_9PROT|nr:hypothetical protein [Eilatimonas milleporae]RMB08008.1 hypothetical protein BXY39_2103 [Eilatimonas milleporae]
MSTDFLAGVNASLLNDTSTSLFPSIKDKIGGTSTITVEGVKVSVTWSLTEAPVFDFSQSGTAAFKVDLSLGISVTPEGGKPSSTKVPATADAQAAITGSGDLSFSVTDMTFNSEDPFLQKVLDIKKPEIIGQVQSLLSAIQLPIGPIEGTSFQGYAVAVVSDALNVGATISGGASISSSAPTSTDLGLGLVLSNGLMQNVVRNVWWNHTEKSFRPNSDTTVNINGYSFSVSGGRLNLALNLGGKYELDVGIGTAKWNIDIGTVHVTLNISIDDKNNVNLAGGSVSTPSVSIKPDNFLATITSIAAGPIVTLILNEVVANMIPGQIKDHLAGTIYTVPTVSSSFQGVDFSLTPDKLSLTVNGSEVDVRGSASVSVTS